MEATAARVERGQFLWHELLTKDKKAAIDFYKHVIGWDTQDYDFPEDDGPDYTMWLAGESPVGGVMEFDESTMSGMSTGWTGSVHTPDVDAAVRHAKELGGSVFAEPMDVPTVGRMAGLIDPQGASIWIMSPAGDPMPEPPLARSFSWNELVTTDSAAAFEFYRQLFSWDKQDEMDMGDGWMYLIYGRGNQMYGGIYNSPPEKTAPPHWLYYVNVDDLDAALERVKERGGKVQSGPMEVPGGDHVAECIDPEGITFALHESKK